LDTVSRQIFRDIQETQSSGSKMEIRISCKEFSRNERDNLLLEELERVIEGAMRPEIFSPLLTVIKIGYDCECNSMTQCRFVHSIEYADQDSICQAYNRMQ